MSKTLKLLFAAAALTATTIASATPIVGELTLSVGVVKITRDFIDWNNNGDAGEGAPTCPGCNVNNPPTGSSPTYGQFLTSAPRNGSFSFANLGNSLGLIQDLANPLSANPLINPGSSGNFFPLATVTSIDKFLQFNNKPNWLFTATYMFAGNVPGSPFTLNPQGNGTTASMTVIGYACDMAASGSSTVCDPTDDLTRWSLTMTAAFTESPADLQAQFLATGQLPEKGWVGNLVATALPEPASLALTGLALAGLGFAGRRRQTNK